MVNRLIHEHVCFPDWCNYIWDNIYVTILISCYMGAILECVEKLILKVLRYVWLYLPVNSGSCLIFFGEKLLL